MNILKGRSKNLSQFWIFQNKKKIRFWPITPKWKQIQKNQDQASKAKYSSFHITQKHKRYMILGERFWFLKLGEKKSERLKSSITNDILWLLKLAQSWIFLHQTKDTTCTFCLKKKVSWLAKWSWRKSPFSKHGDFWVFKIWKIIDFLFISLFM